MSEGQRNFLAVDQGQQSIREGLPFDSFGSAPSSPYQTLSGVLSILRQRWKTVVYAALIVLVLGTIVCFFIKSYSATTIIEVNKDDPSDNDANQPNGATLTTDDIKSEVQTDISILQTDDGLILAVIKNLNLMQVPLFQKAIVPSEKGKPIDQAPKTRDRLLKIFRGRLKVDSPTDTRLITITFKSNDPVLSANITNGLANTFIDDTLRRRQASIVRSSAWLQHELGDLKKQVEASEQRLADYERNTGLAGISLTGSANGNGASSISVTPENTVTARLLGLNQELTAAEANRISTEQVYRLVQSQDPESVLGLGPMSVASGSGGGGGSITPDGIALVSSLRAQEADLSRQYSAAAVKYGENNPRLIQLQQQIDSTKQALQSELERIKQRAANDYLYAKRNEDSIRQRFTAQEDAANSMADKTVKLQLIAQEAFSNRALYEGLFSKLQTASLSSGTRASRISIVDMALPAGTPSSPKWGLYLLVILVAGVFVGVTAAFLLESLDETIRTPNDLSDIHGLAMLGYIPRLALSDTADGRDRSAQLIEAPRSPFSEAFRGLRTSVNLLIPPSSRRSFLVTSALGGDGKTTVTYNLGVAFAQQGARVLLIDCDVRNPDLHKLFHTSLSPGLTDVCGEPSLPTNQGIIQHSALPGLFLLPAGVSPNLPSELFESAAFEMTLGRLSSEYDYVLIDSPPILAVTDASIIAGKVAGVIAVLRSRRTTRAVLSGLMRAMQRTNAAHLSFVLNDVQHPTLDGFYDYSYSREKEGNLVANA